MLFYIAKELSDLEDYENLTILNELLKTLRTMGIGILSKEIEMFSKDYSFISTTKKLSIKKIFSISEKINNGSKISDLFEVGKFKELLESVLKN